MEADDCYFAPMPTFKVSSLQEASTDYLDLPAFLRRGESVSVYDAQPAYSEFEGDTELTPRGVNEWLRKTPKRRWPNSYLELARMGLGASVIDWLELSLANQEGTLVSEAIVVAAFLYVMSQPDLFELSVKSKGFAQRVMSVISQLKQVATDKSDLDFTGLDVELVDKILATLKEMTAEHWPDQVYTLVPSA